MKMKITYLGGPCYLLEIGSFRIISDPSFDPQGSFKEEGPGHVLTKIMQPPIAAEDIGKLDLVLASHTHHLDNFDVKGREVAATADLILTTPQSVEHIENGTAIGLATWESHTITNAKGEKITITATPSVHTSNPDIRHIIGETTGWILEWDGQEKGVFYISGDTVYIPELEEISNRYKIASSILHLGAANVPAVGDDVLTMTAVDAPKAVKLMSLPEVYPAHFEGWRHFSEGAWLIEREFRLAEMEDKLKMLRPGESAHPNI